MKMSLTLLAAVAGGCAAWTDVVPVEYADRDAKGLRVYDPIPLLVVTAEQTSIVFVPDFERGYSVRFHAWLAKNNSSIKLADGALMTEMGSNLDTTGLLSLLQSVGGKAIENAEQLSAFGQPVTGAITGKEGIYRFDFDETGRFTGLTEVDIP